MFKPSEYLDMGHTQHHALFETLENEDKPVWEAIAQIGDYLKFRLTPGMEGTLVGRPFIGEKVYIGDGTVVEQGAFIKGPAWIGSNCHIRSGAYIREHVILGDGVVAGNSSEFKNCVLFDGCEVPHFNYVGDSILGYKAHLGAGVILSNVKLTRDEISVLHDGCMIPTGLRKFGAIIGDKTEVGCNSVINPGSVLGKNCILYPGTQWRGVLGHQSVVKWSQQQTIMQRRAR